VSCLFLSGEARLSLDWRCHSHTEGRDCVFGGTCGRAQLTGGPGAKLLSPIALCERVKLVYSNFVHRLITAGNTVQVTNTTKEGVV